MSIANRLKNVNTPPSSGREQRARERTANTEEIKPHIREVKTRGNTYPRRKRPNASDLEIMERRKTNGMASNVKIKRDLESDRRGKMRREIKSNAYHPRIERTMNKPSF